MSTILFTDNIDEYLKEDDVINFGNENIMQLANVLYQGTSDEVEYIEDVNFQLCEELKACDYLNCAPSQGQLT